MTTHLFILRGKIAPKARPRVTKHGTFYPKTYKLWKEAAIKSLKEQSTGLNLPVTLAVVNVVLTGQKRGDADNILGACLDALVQSGILLDDRLSCVRGVSLFLEDGKQAEARITILT